MKKQKNLRNKTLTDTRSELHKNMRNFLTSCEPKAEKIIIESGSAAVETHSINLVKRNEDIREEF
jgi:hypothetical protein